jgi:pimeloyl-ACP methyl ester carboxylesterase
MASKEGFANVNGTRLYYEVAGSGFPLVLIHGITLDTRMWDDQLAAFAGHFQVIRYDVRGFGRSTLPTDEDYSNADDLKALLDHLGIASTFVLGLSMGGGIAIDFALTYPETVDALILADSAVGGFQLSPERAALVNAISSKAKETGIPAAKKLWLDDPLFGSAREIPVVRSRLAEIVSDYSGWHWIKGPRRQAFPPPVNRLHEIDIATLVIVGERDIPDFQAIAGTLHQRIPHAQKVVLPGVGHMCNMEAPDQFNTTVLAFLAPMSKVDERDIGNPEHQGSYVHQRQCVNVFAARTVERDAAFFIPYLNPGMSLLDCGAGPGTITVGLSQLVAPGEAVGIDNDETQVEVASAHAKKRNVSNVRFECGDICSLKFPDESFDRVFVSGVLEHLKDPLSALNEVFRVLKRGGALAVRHGDFDGWLDWPRTPAIEQGVELYMRMWRRGGGEPCFGKAQKALLREAGFTRIEASASCEWFGTPEAIKGFSEARIRSLNGISEEMINLGWSTREEINDMVSALEEWGEHPDAFLMIPWCEAVGWKE